MHAVTEPILAECKARGGRDAGAYRDRRATRQSAKSGPPLRGRLGKPAGGVATLARGPTGPRCAPLLPSGLPKTITVCISGRVRVL